MKINHLKKAEFHQPFLFFLFQERIDNFWFYFIIDISLYRSCSKGWVINFINDFLNFCLAESREFHLIVFFPGRKEGFYLLIENGSQIFFTERSENDFMINSIGEFWSKEILQLFQNSGLNIIKLFVINISFCPSIKSD